MVFPEKNSFSSDHTSALSSTVIVQPPTPYPSPPPWPDTKAVILRTSFPSKANSTVLPALLPAVLSNVHPLSSFTDIYHCFNSPSVVILYSIVRTSLPLLGQPATIIIQLLSCYPPYPLPPPHTLYGQWTTVILLLSSKPHSPS